MKLYSSHAWSQERRELSMSKFCLWLIYITCRSAKRKPQQQNQCVSTTQQLIIQQLLLKIFWKLLAYRRPTPQSQPHPAHGPYGPSFTGFKTTSRNVQRSGLFYRLLAKQIITHKESSLASLMKEREDCINSFRKSSFLGSSEFFSWRLTPAERCLVFPLQSHVAFINSKNCSGFAVSFILCTPNNFTFELCRIW